MNRDFKGVWIPKNIWLNKNLSVTDKVLLAEINSLDNEDHCTASNEYFADFFGVGVATITRSIKKLREMGYIEAEMVTSKTGNYRVIKVVEWYNQNDDTPLIKMSRGCNQNDETPLIKMINNYNSNSNINNNVVISKDITTSEEGKAESSIESKPDISDDFLLHDTVKKKPNLYQQCIGLINNRYIDNSELRKLLVQYLDLRFEMKDKPLYANQWKGMLNKLDELHTNGFSYEEVVKQSIERGYANFYPINSYSTKTNPDTNTAPQYKADRSTLVRNEDGSFVSF